MVIWELVYTTSIDEWRPTLLLHTYDYKLIIFKDVSADVRMIYGIILCKSLSSNEVLGQSYSGSNISNQIQLKKTFVYNEMQAYGFKNPDPVCLQDLIS